MSRILAGHGLIAGLYSNPHGQAMAQVQCIHLEKLKADKKFMMKGSRGSKPSRPNIEV
jgi:hypothetical protein